MNNNEYDTKKIDVDFKFVVTSRLASYNSNIVNQWLRKAYSSGMNDVIKHLRMRLLDTIDESDADKRAGLNVAIRILNELENSNVQVTLL